MKNLNETIRRVKDYEPLWDGWTFTGALIGSGGSGCVLELKKGDERSVVKVIYVDDNTEKYNAVKNEIETMITLRNDYLVECLDYREEEVFNRKGEKVGYDFLIRMNKYEPFAEFLREEEFDANALCVQLSLEIGLALCALHSHGILHRDVKPENIFIDRSGEKPHFRLGDFGVSKKISDMSGLTATGTLNFMAPESYKYYEYSYHSDIYNLGMTLYYILNDLNFPKYVEEKSQSDIDANTELRLSGEKFPTPVFGSTALQKVVMKACEAKPKDRYKDVSEMLGELFGQTIDRAGVQKPKTPLSEETVYHKRVTIKRKINSAREIVKVFFNRRAVISMIALLLVSALTVIPSTFEAKRNKQSFEQKLFAVLKTNDTEAFNVVINKGSPELSETTVQKYCDDIIDDYNYGRIEYADAQKQMVGLKSTVGNRFADIFDNRSNLLRELYKSKQSYINAESYLSYGSIIPAVESYADVIKSDYNYSNARNQIKNNIRKYVAELPYDDKPEIGLFDDCEWHLNTYYYNNRETINKIGSFSILDSWKRHEYLLFYNALEDYYTMRSDIDTNFFYNGSLSLLETIENFNKDSNGFFDEIFTKYKNAFKKSVVHFIDNIHSDPYIEIQRYNRIENRDRIKKYIDDNTYQRMENALSYKTINDIFDSNEYYIHDTGGVIDWKVKSGNLNGFSSYIDLIHGFSLFPNNSPFDDEIKGYKEIDLFRENGFLDSVSGVIAIMDKDRINGRITFSGSKNGNDYEIIKEPIELGALDDHSAMGFDIDLSNYSSLRIEFEAHNTSKNSLNQFEDISTSPWKSPYKFYIARCLFHENTFSTD